MEFVNHYWAFLWCWCRLDSLLALGVEAGRGSKRPVLTATSFPILSLGLGDLRPIYNVLDTELMLIRQSLGDNPPRTLQQPHHHLRLLNYDANSSLPPSPELLSPRLVPSCKERLPDHEWSVLHALRRDANDQLNSHRHSK